ncbi:clathrin light chain [Diutina catenulata]
MDKFPEIDVDGEEISGDFLAREKELMGDEFQTEHDEEINDFEAKFPEVDDHQEEEAPKKEESINDNQFEGWESQRSETQGEKSLDLGSSEPIKEWRQRRDLEIEERETANKKKKEDITKKAQQTIDDFYDNYNEKKDKHAKEVVDEQTKYVEKRDGFLGRGTLWDRVNELVKEVGEVPSEGRDKTRFKEVLTKLKGKENVPGAGGYKQE